MIRSTSIYLRSSNLMTCLVGVFFLAAMLPSESVGEPIGNPSENLGELSPPHDRNEIPMDRDDASLSHKIRQALQEDDVLSPDAKNIHITTSVHGKVALSGPVKSEAEKQRIERIARRFIDEGALTTNLVIASAGLDSTARGQLKSEESSDAGE